MLATRLERCSQSLDQPTPNSVSFRLHDQFICCSTTVWMVRIFRCGPLFLSLQLCAKVEVFSSAFFFIFIFALLLAATRTLLPVCSHNICYSRFGILRDRCHRPQCRVCERFYWLRRSEIVSLLRCYCCFRCGRKSSYRRNLPPNRRRWCFVSREGKEFYVGHLCVRLRGCPSTIIISGVLQFKLDCCVLELEDKKKKTINGSVLVLRLTLFVFVFFFQ